MPSGLVAIAEKQGLPIETINQAANYYLHKTHFKPFLIPWIQGQKSTLFRPHFSLFLELKLARLSPSDAEDIFAYGKKFPDEVSRANIEWDKLKPIYGQKAGWPKLEAFFRGL